MSFDHDRAFYRLQYPEQAGETVSGTLEFPEDDPLEIEGTVVRLQGGEVAVKCTARPIPLRLVLREQRRLRRRFPFRA